MRECMSEALKSDVNVSNPQYYLNEGGGNQAQEKSVPYAGLI